MENMDLEDLVALRAAMPAPERCQAIRLAVPDASQSWLAAQIGVSRSAVSLYERGLRQPRPEHLRRWFRALVDLERIASVTGNVPQQS